MKNTLLCFLMCIVFSSAWAQDRKITGKVTSVDDGQALPGVNVILKGTAVGTVTSSDGNYTLTVPSAGGTLIFSFIGLVTQEVTIDSRSQIDVALQSDVTQLNEVVVTGAGGIESRKREMGYNATSVGVVQLTQAKPLNVAAGLTGKVAGLQINTTTSGVNPNVRVTLRGNRSITGNNEALIVVDNVVVPNTVLTSLNPQDIAEITVLNGSNAAALYGSDASNGALIITTKKGTKGQTTVTLSHSMNFEQVSFFPQTQTEFGSGSNPGYPTVYVPYENQQYGPRFDGTMRQIGRPLEDGSIQEVPYTGNDSKHDFWETGITNQTDLSISGGDEKSTTFFSLQYLKNKGTTPKDDFKRISMRLNGNRKFNDMLELTYSSNYIHNRYDITTQTNNMYQELLNTPSQVSLTNYKDWRNNPFANPNGYYNEYYSNPYWTIEAFRRDERNDVLIGNAELKFKPWSFLDIVARGGVSNAHRTRKDKNAQFILTDYTKSVSSSKTDVFGGVNDESFATNQVNGDLFTQFKKDISEKFYLSVIAGMSVRVNQTKILATQGNGLVVPGLYNITNRVGEPFANEANFDARQAGAYGQIRLGYKDYLFLEVTGRNDWVSVLSPENRSFFYPAASLSFVATDAVEALKFNGAVELIKLRGGWSQVGQVNLGNKKVDYGAYALQSTFAPTQGFPYGSLSGYALSNTLVAKNLRPEITTGQEIGVDFSLRDNKVTGNFTWYDTRTVDQTVATGVTATSGYTTLLQNTGEVSNSGYEAHLNIVAYRSPSGLQISFAGNYTYSTNKVVSISNDLPRLQLSTGGQAQVYAIEGQPFPALLGTGYLRDPQGRVIVDRQTGYPSAAPDLVSFGNTVPKHRLGLSGEVIFKGLRISALFEYRAGYSILFNGGSTFDFSGASITSAYYNRERFVMPNSSYADPNNDGQYIANTNITVSDGGTAFWTDGSFNNNIADNYVISGDYWKLRELVLTYDLPKALLGKTKVIKNASIALQGRNLFIWMPMSNVYTDPDFNFADSNAIGIITLANTPPTRYYGATFSLTF